MKNSTMAIFAIVYTDSLECAVKVSEQLDRESAVIVLSFGNNLLH